MATLIVLLCGVLATLGATAGLGVLVFGGGGFQARIEARLKREDAAPARGPLLGTGLPPGLVKTLTRWGQTAGRGAIETDKRAELRLTLVQAGFYDDRAVEVFFGIRAATAAGAATLGLLVVLLAGAHGVAAVSGGVMLGANLGLFAPNLLLRRRIAERRLALERALPEVLDLMVVSLEAGASLSAALQRVVAEFGELYPIVSEQFGLVLMEMQAGSSRAEALNRLAHRSPTEELRSITTMIIQSEAVGASLGDTLRVCSEELRKTRFLEAERKASELPVKMAFPLVLCIFPCLIASVFIPAAIRILRTLIHV
jgi:tight adherence protein C